ncbi:hypothetical protein OAO55_01710 [Bacteroidales bacterium]|nr:hypothetical protein [Bacteroidales bacterium]
MFNISDDKQCYQLGDRFNLTIKAKQTGVYCSNGIEKIKLFTKGLKIEHQQAWQEIKPGLWKTELQLLVIGNKKNQLQITAYRKTDKGTIVNTKTFKFKGL